VGNKNVRRILWLALLAFVLANVIAGFQAYRFTHFIQADINRTKDPRELSFLSKAQTVLLGVKLPRPVAKSIPSQPYKTITLQSNKKIECWSVQTDNANAKGTFILFHGYGGEKSSMLSKSNELIRMGYNVLLVDFMGCGGSEGNQTTIGYKESEEVKTAYDYVAGTGEKKIYLLGTSMGAAAILKALHDYPIQPSGAIVECPFGTMYVTTCNRFHKMGLPPFPMAGLLMIWGSIENGFWAFDNKPEEYARTVKCPVLLLYGALDDKVTEQETKNIYNNLKGPRQLVIYPNAGHENFLNKYYNEWVRDVETFLVSNQ
jgi:alpha-beta hydrolase superfamily lysophospholipase